MNENNQEKAIQSAKYIEFKAIRKPSFYGIPYKEDAPEFELFKELDQLGWEVEGEFYRSKDILGSQTYFNAQKKFLKASQDSQGYQLDTPPFSILEINFLLRAYCTELQGDVKVIGNNKELRVYLNKGVSDAILSQVVVILQTEMTCSERMQKIYEAQTKDQSHEIIYHCGQYILETQNSKRVEDLHLVHWVRAVAFEKMSKELLRTNPNDTLYYYTAFYYCLKSKMDLLDTLRIGELKNEQSHDYIEKIKPLILGRLKDPKLSKPKPVRLNKKNLYFLQVMHAEDVRGIKGKIWLFNFLKELYPDDVSLESRCSFLSTREAKIAHAYNLIYEKKHEEAIVVFWQLLNNLQGENDIEHADYYERLAYLYVKLKQWENALNTSNQAQQIYPLEMSALAIRAEVAFGQGLYEEAISHYKCIVSLAHTSANNPIYTRDEITTYFTHALYGLGKCYVFLNEHEKAIEHYLNACEKFQNTGFDKIKPSVFIRILHSQNCLYEQNVPLKFSGKINDRKIFFYAIQNTYQYAEKLLLKTFQNLPDSAFKTYFCNELTRHFVEKKNPEKLILLCQQLTKNTITLSPEILISFLDTLSILECPQFQENSNKQMLVSLCETALIQYPNHVDLYKSVTNTLFIHAQLNKVTPIFIGLIQNRFDIYLAIPKPNSAQLHYELAETLTLVNPTEAFLSYQKAIELGIKNAKVKKLTISALNVISWGLLLGKKKDDLQPIVLQKIVQLASTSDPFYKNLTDLLLEENKNTVPQDFRFEMILSLAECFCESNQIQKIMKSFSLFEKMLEMYSDTFDVCSKIFSLYPLLNSSKSLPKEALWDFYKTVGEKISYHPALAKGLINALLKKTVVLPPIASSYQLLYEIAHLYPEYSLDCCDEALSLLPNLTELNVKLHEKFIGCLLKQNHHEKAFHYYLKVKHLLTSSELHEKFTHHIYDQKKAPSLEEEEFMIEQFGNHPKNLRSTAQVMLLTNNPKTKLYDLFMSQLANHGNNKHIQAYYQLIQLFKDKKQLKQRKKILLQIGEICQLNDDDISEKKVKILDLCTDVIISYPKSCGKNIIHSILNLLLPDIDITFNMLQKLIEMPKMATALLLFREALKRSPNYYEKLLSAFPSVKTEQLNEQLVTIFLELNEFNLAFNYYQEHCSENQSKTLPIKLLSSINDLTAPDFSEFCFNHAKPYFELTLSLLNSNEHSLAQQMLEKFSNFCFSCLHNKNLQNDQEIVYPIDLLLTNDIIASKVIRKLIEKKQLSSALFIFKKSLISFPTQNYPILMDIFPKHQHHQMMEILLENGDLPWCIDYLLQQDYNSELAGKLLTRIQNFSSEAFEKHSKLCFQFANLVLKNDQGNAKPLAEEMLLKIRLKMDENMVYPISHWLTNDIMISKVIKKLIEKKQLPSALFIFKKSLISLPTESYPTLIANFPRHQYHQMMEILLENGDLPWCIDYLLQQDYDSELSWKLLARIQNFSSEELEKFCSNHPKLCFKFANLILKNDQGNGKPLAEEMLLKISSKIDKHSSLYRKIINALYHRTTLKLEGPVTDFFKLLTEQFGDEKVYLTGSRVLALINKKVTSSNDWDFIVFCEESEADILLGENGLKFRKSEKLPGLYTKIVTAGSPPQETIIEVFCVKPIPEKTIEEQLRLNIEERDFTVCALMLNQYGVLFDFVGGEEDAKNHILRSIKPSFQSFTKDPIRLLRATKYCVNEFEWTKELKNGLVQWATPFQNLEFDVRDHLYAVIVKHLTGLNETQRKAYIDLLVEEKLWKKLFLYETRIGLRDSFQLEIPYERPYNKPMYVPQNPYNFFPQYTFPIFIPNPYITITNENKTPSMSLRPSKDNEEDE